MKLGCYLFWYLLCQGEWRKSPRPSKEIQKGTREGIGKHLQRMFVKMPEGVMEES
jgi:hypothetical protein